MAGTLTISTLSDGTNSTSSTNCIQGSAKAWVNYNGQTATIRGSYNVTSVTKAGTGQYTVNFTNALSDANYSAAASASYDATSTTNGICYYSVRTYATNSISFLMFTQGGQFTDYAIVSVACFR